jgi:hypothetical protein
MKIIKKENGNVLLTDGSGNTVKRFPEGAVIELENNGRGEFVRIAYGHQNKHDIYPSTITATQIEPDAEVAFSGTAQNLLNLLSTSFFFEVAGGYEGDDYIDSYFYSVTVTNGDTYPFLIHTEDIADGQAVSLEVDYLATRANSGGIGRRSTIARYASNISGVLSAAAQATELTSSNYAVSASIVTNGTSLELQINIAGGELVYNFWIKVRKIAK